MSTILSRWSAWTIGSFSYSIVRCLWEHSISPVWFIWPAVSLTFIVIYEIGRAHRAKAAK